MFKKIQIFMMIKTIKNIYFSLKKKCQKFHEKSVKCHEKSVHEKSLSQNIQKSFCA
jgi:hypothetical protein